MSGWPRVRRSRTGAGAVVAFSAAEVRTEVSLDGLDEASELAALGDLVLGFDHYGRLAELRVMGSPESVLPPGALEEAVAAD